ncbi:hypothetical protein [Achromobacter aegrifaciens]
MYLTQGLHRAGRLHPGKMALREGEQSWTYAALIDWTARKECPKTHEFLGEFADVGRRQGAEVRAAAEPCIQVRGRRRAG